MLSFIKHCKPNAMYRSYVGTADGTDQVYVDVSYKTDAPVWERVCSVTGGPPTYTPLASPYQCLTQWDYGQVVGWTGGETTFGMYDVKTGTASVLTFRSGSRPFTIWAHGWPYYVTSYWTSGFGTDYILAEWHDYGQYPKTPSAVIASAATGTMAKQTTSMTQGADGRITAVYHNGTQLVRMASVDHGRTWAEDALLGALGTKPFESWCLGWGYRVLTYWNDGVTYMRRFDPSGARMDVSDIVVFASVAEQAVSVDWDNSGRVFAMAVDGTTPLTVISNDNGVTWA